MPTKTPAKVVSIEERRRVGRPARISRESILDAAESIPLGTLTLPLLAQRLGVRTPALYRYFESRDALLTAMGARRYTGLTFKQPDPAHWREWLLGIATDVYRMYCANPVMLLVPNSRHVSSGLALYEAALETLVGAGFSDQEAAFTFINVMASVRQYASSSIHQGTPIANAVNDVLSTAGTDYPRIRSGIAALKKNKQIEADFLDWLVSSLPEPKRRR